ncbi:YdiU family protein [bacterium]|nr:YdiU family protein [bacterium]
MSKLTPTKYQADPIHLALDQRFYREVKAAQFPEHQLRFRNDRAAASIGFTGFSDDEWISHFGKFIALPDNIGTPLALCYHGHQFGHYNPELGDGRGFLFAQMRADDGRILDLGTKGSGTTPFSRTADGRLTLKGAVREILATEMLDALGVNTSKTLSVIETGESLERNDEPSPTRGAVLVRLSHSHIRIGSFQRLSYLDDGEGLERLVRHVVRHYYKDALDADAAIAELAPAFLSVVGDAVAQTTGGWLAAGFVHGVLNTDNFNVTGESFDYGPWRFLPHFDPGFTAAYFDQAGRYAYGRQADASMWAVCRLADCLVRFCDQELLEAALQDFYPKMEASLSAQISWRLGVSPASDLDKGQELCRQFYNAARASQCGFDQLFHDFRGGRQRRGSYDPADIAGFCEILQDLGPITPKDDAFFDREQAISMTIEEVEAIWSPIAASDDWSALYAKIDDIRLMGAALRGAST